MSLLSDEKDLKLCSLLFVISYFFFILVDRVYLNKEILDVLVSIIFLGRSVVTFWIYTPKFSP